MLCKKFVFIGLLSSILFTKQCIATCSVNLDQSQKSSVPSTSIVQYHTKVEQAEHPVCIYSQLAPTLAIMKIFLGSSFKPLPSDFKYTPGETAYPPELYENVRAFFGSPEFTPSRDCMGDQHIDLDDELTNTICKLIHIEQEETMKGNVVLYHGLDGSILFMYRYFSELFSHLTGHQFPKFVLRGDHLYALNPKTKGIFQTLKEVRETYDVAGLTSQVGDYGQGVDVKTLHCNIALSVGPGTSLSTASSVGFLCNSFNAYKISIIDTITSTLVFQGMPIKVARKCAEEAEELFKKNFLAKYKSNGGILAISLPKNQINNLALHVCVNGREYNPILEECEKNIRRIFEKDMYYPISVNDLPLSIYLSKIGSDPSADVNQVVNEIEKGMGFDHESWEQHLEKSKEDELTEVIKKCIDSLTSKGSSISTLLENISAASKKSISRQAAIDLTNEIALYLHPQIPAEIFGFFRHMPEPSQESILKSEFEKLVGEHVEAILKSPFRPVDNVLVIPSRSGTADVQPDEAEGVLKQAPIEAIPFLIERGLFEKAETLIKKCKDFCQNESIKIALPRAITSAVKNGFTDISNFFINCGISLKSIIHKDDFPILMPELIIQGSYQYYNNMVDILLNENLSREELIQISRFVQPGPFSHWDKLLDKCKSDQNTIEEIFIQAGKDNRLDDNTTLSFMKHGFSFNPEEIPTEKQHFDMLFKFFKNKTDCRLVESIANIITYYKLNLSKHKDLCILLAGSGKLYFGDQLSVRHTPKGYQVNDIEKGVYCDISFDDLNNLSSFTFDLPYGMHYDSDHAKALCDYFTKRFGRTYSIEIFQKLCETKEACSFSRSHKASVALSLETSSPDVWLKALEKEKSWDAAEKLANEVKDLDVLFFNLKSFDELAGDKLIALGSPVSKEAREAFVNRWFIDLMEKSRKTIDEITEAQGNEQKVQQICGNSPKFISSKCCSELIAGKYRPEDIMSGCPTDDSDRQAVMEFIEKEIQSDPSKLEDIGFIATSLRKDLLPESIVRDPRQLETLFSKLGPDRLFYIACDLLKSDNPLLKQFIEERIDKIFYPGTSVKMKDAMAILAKYNMLDHDNM